MCECVYCSIVGGFPICRITNKYPHISCELYEPDCESPFEGMVESWRKTKVRYPTWNQVM